MSTNLSAGPQWINSTVSSIIPSMLSATADASINYQLRFTSVGLNYHHGTNAGAGYLLGAEYDTAGANFSKTFGLDLTIGLTAGYLRTAALNSSSVISAKYGGIEATRRIGRNVIVFANYTGTSQSANSALPSSALNQLLNVIGFGFGYSPRETHLRQ
jgi:hypothetical protein